LGEKEENSPQPYWRNFDVTEVTPRIVAQNREYDKQTLELNEQNLIEMVTQERCRR